MVGNRMDSEQAFSAKNFGSTESNQSLCSSNSSGRIRPRPDTAPRRSFVSFDNKSLGQRRVSNSSMHSFGSGSFRSFNGNGSQNSRFNMQNSSVFGSSSNFGSGANFGSSTFGNSSSRSASTSNAAFSQRVQSTSGMRRNASHNSSSGGLSTSSVASSASQRRWKADGMMQMVQRSNASSVKTVIGEIETRCAEFTRFSILLASAEEDANSSMSSISSSGTMACVIPRHTEEAQ